MSKYFKTTGLGSLGATTACGGADPNDYAWANGICTNRKTGAKYVGDQSKSNCQCLFGPPPSRAGQVFDFLKGQLLPQAQNQFVGPQGQPSSSFTGSGLMLPAVAVVGGVALILLLKKKK
jgi:hypothetical protein